MMWRGTATEEALPQREVSAAAAEPEPFAATVPSAVPVPEPSTSVIITNWNYAHFLADCIDSVLGQTRPPDEIVVVDDGSTDASADVLRRYAGRVTVHTKPNGGQASAMNAGFRLSTGSIVLLLDGDDLLRPDAIETIVTNWTDDLSALSFGLELIDGDGRSLGLYEASFNADDGDNRPRLLASGSFVFAPTSGHAFSRAFLASIFPMAEERWRISADAYVARAAALFGRMAVIRRALAAYRVHGGNNYERQGLSRLWMEDRGMNDMADAIASMAELRSIPAGSDAEGELIRLQLWLRALELRVRLLERNGRTADLTSLVRRALGATLRSRLPLRDRVAAAVPLAVLRLGGWRSPALRRWAEDSRSGRHIFARLFDRAGFARLEQKLAELPWPRWPESLPYGETLSLPAAGRVRNILAGGWRGPQLDGRRWSHGGEAAIEFRIDPARYPVRVNLGVQLDPAWQNGPVTFTVMSAAGRIWAGFPSDGCTISLQLPHDPLTEGAPLRLVIRCEPANQAQARREPKPRFTLGWVTAWPEYGRPPAPHLPLGGRLDFARLVSADPAGLGWRIDDSGIARLAAPEARCYLTMVAGDEPLELSLTPADPLSQGWLRILCEGSEIFAGEPAPGTELRARVPPSADGGSIRLELLFSFTPHDATDTAKPGFAEIGLQAVRRSPIARGFREVGPASYPRLNLGQRLSFDAPATAALYLLQGWDTPDELGVRNMAAEASLAFSVDARATDLQLHLELEPSLPPVEGRRHLVGVSVRGELLQMAELAGPGTLQVPLPATASEPNGDTVVSLHSVRSEPEGGAGSAPLPAYAGIDLRAVTLSGTLDLSANEPGSRLPGPPYPVPSHAALLEAARSELASPPDDPGRMERISALRTRLAMCLWSLDPRSLGSIAARPGGLDTIEALGAAAAGVSPATADHALVGEIEALARSAPSPADRLRIFLCSMLLVPACRIPLDPDLTALPAPLLFDSWPVARYLTRDPAVIETDGEIARLLDHLERLLVSVHAVLGTEREGSARYTLAARTMHALHSQKILFSDANLSRYARLKGRCIERYLSRAGCLLALPAGEQGAAPRLRIGMLVRDVLATPEGWLLLGMYRDLDRSRFEPVLITLARSAATLDAGKCFEREVCLAEMSVEQAVDAVRGLGLHILVVGSFVTGFEKLTAIVAHKLAPVQVLLSAICPVTTGLRSFDFALSSASTEPQEAQAQYTERLVLFPGPFQCFDFAGIRAEENGEPEPLRRTLAVPDDAVLLVSGAMMHKIVPELLRSWVQILAAAPEALLVLYPFARNWETPDVSPRFLDWLRRELAAAGVAEDRLKLLPEQTPGQVRRILQGADLYLDSFPYAGATTVVEALACGLPAVTLDGRTQRGRQGASWARALDLDHLVATTAQEYTEIAVRLATDSALRRDAAARLRKASGTPPVYADAAGFGLRFSDALAGLAAEKGLSIGAGEASRPDAPLAAPWVRASTAPAEIGPASPYRYVFHHLHKTGGTTCAEVFRSWFRVRDDYGEPWAEHNPAPPHAVGSFEPDEMLCGHFETDSTRLWVRYPHILADRRYRLISFLREPVELAQSDYFFRTEGLNGRPGFVPVTLGEHLRKAKGMFGTHFNFEDHNWRQVLDRYWFVGTLERLPECLAWLGEVFGKPLPPIPRLNETPRPVAADPEDIAIFKERNQRDYMIFEEINRRLDSRLGYRAISEGG